MTIRIILIFCLLHWMSVFHAEIIHREGLILCKLGNLPHRGLGMLFYSAMKHPERQDFQFDYLKWYFNFSQIGFIQEGMTKPVGSFYAIEQARNFPKNPDLRDLKKAIMHNHKLRVQQQEKR